jgi:hypothetical protein
MISLTSFVALGRLHKASLASALVVLILAAALALGSAGRWPSLDYTTIAAALACGYVALTLWKIEVAYWVSSVSSLCCHLPHCPSRLDLPHVSGFDHDGSVLVWLAPVALDVGRSP